MVVGEEASAGAAPEEGAGAVGPAPPPPPPHTNGTSSHAKHGAISSNIHNIMGGMECTEGVKLHNHKRKLRQRFDIVRKLGQGTYGKVQLGINKETGQEVAIKTIKKAKIETEADLVRIRREIQIMSSVRHPNIIHIYEVFENREKMVLVMEYAAGGELYDYLSERKVLAELEARRIFRQIATAVYYCHKHKICHRDLKLENILLDETGNAKIADFGLSNVFDEQRLLSTFCGSPLYASPEIVKGTPYHGPEVDCWSLGVLLYTLVYGAMPFDGSNFKKLVKQISQGDYFEPKKPSPASPLIRDMLTVTPRKRADVERICSHWWVNEGYAENCLEQAEMLANQTPVRLDLLLSLAPAPSSSDKLVVPETKTEETTPVSALPPTSFPRSQSVGSLMELDYPSRKPSPPRLPLPPPPSVPPPPLAGEEAAAAAPKRKLQECPSGETGAKRKETKPTQPKPAKKVEEKKEEVKSKDESMDVDQTVEQENKSPVKIKEKRKSIKVKEESAAKAVAEKPEEPTTVPNKDDQPSCSEILTDKNAKVKRKKKVESIKSETNGVETNSEVTTPVVENALIPESVVAINEVKPAAETPVVTPVETPVVLESVAPVPPEVVAVKEEVITKEPSPKVEKKEESPKVVESPVKRRPQSLKTRTKTEELTKLDSSSPEKSPEVSTPKTDVRRRSSIFEKAEKFNSMSTSNIDNNKPSPEKPKKLFIPGVKISDFKKAFEKKTPTKSASTSKATEEPKKEIIKLKPTTKSESPKIEKKETVPKLVSPLSPSEKKPISEEAQIKKVKEVVKKSPEKIVPPKPKAISPFKETTPKPKAVSPFKKTTPKPKAVSPAKEDSPKVPSPVKVVESPVQVEPETKPSEPKKKSTTMKIILESNAKSATLPRRTSKAEIRLNNPAPATLPAKPEYRTEVEHMVGSPEGIKTQRSEVAFPVAAPTVPRQARPYKHSNTAPTSFRSVSLEPESRVKERIIPIRMEGEEEPKPPALPPKPAPVKRESLSRQSTQESEPETVRGEPIRKSPREFIIPIAVEGGGYITPRAGSLEPSSEPSTPGTPTRGRPGRISRPLGRRMGLLSEGDDLTPEPTNGIAPPLHRLSSLVSDHVEEEGPVSGGGTLGRGMHMHRLRSSRPSRPSLDHNDSFSSGEEDDEDDGFEILTAESLFSTLLSRVRSLTQRLNVEEGIRPGFPSARLLGHMQPFATQPHGSLFSNFHSRMGEPLTRRLSDHSRLGRTNSRGDDMGASPWRRSLSRDASDAGDSVYSEHHPRGDIGGLATEYTPTRRMHHPSEQYRPDTYRRGGAHDAQDAYRRSVSTDMHHRQEGYHPHNRPQPNYQRMEPELDQRAAGIYGTLRQPRKTHEDPRQQASRTRSISLNRENSWKKNQRMTPERSTLGKFLAPEIHEMSPPTPPPLTHEERRRGRRVSRFLRPDFFDTPREESAYVRQKEDDERVRRDQRKSVERRPEDSKGHVNRAINSLQQRTNSQDFTESSLIKRAVSSDDCAQYNEQPRGKVTSVLGMFKKMERPPDKNAVSRFRRAQSVYEASSSDSLASAKEQFNDSPRKKQLRGEGSNLKVDVIQRPSAFLPYGQRTPSEEKSIDEDLEEDYSQASRRQDSSSNYGQDDSYDSWSVCSDTPLDPLEDETVSDRIRRKSFYTRFNDYVAPKKPPSNKASPAVAAILERDFRKPHKHHKEPSQVPSSHHHRSSSRHAAEENGMPNGVEPPRQRRYNVYASLPRGWEPKTETEGYYQQAARKMNRYAQFQHPSAPIFPSAPLRRPGHSPSNGVDH